MGILRLQEISGYIDYAHRLKVRVLSLFSLWIGSQIKIAKQKFGYD